MATKTVTGKLTSPSGANVSGELITATLSVAAIIASTQEVAALQVTTLTASDGTWSLTLQANADLTPSTSYYTITAGVGFYCTAIVPQSAGPFKLEDIMAAAPVPAGTVGYQAGSNAVFQSLTVKSSGPYTNLLADGVTPTPAGVNYAKQVDWGGHEFDVVAAGAQAAGLETLFGASIVSGQPTLTVTDGFFTPAMVGWKVFVPAAGDASLNTLSTTIAAYISATQVTLAANAGATVAGGQAQCWPATGVGSDDAAAFALALSQAGVITVFVAQQGPNRFYPVSTLPTLGTGQVIEGANKRGCKILHTGAGLFINLSGNRHALSRLTLRAGSGTTAIVRLTDASFGDYGDLELDGANAVNTTFGLQFYGAVLNSGGNYENHFHQVYSHHSVYGLNALGNANANAVNNNNTFEMCAFNLNRDAGIITAYAQGNLYLGCDAEQNGKVGSGPSTGNMGFAIRLNSGASKGFRWVGGWIEGNKNGTIRWDAAVDSLEITGVVSQYLADGGGNGFSGFTPAFLGKQSVVIDTMGVTSTERAHDSRVKITPIGTPVYSAAITPDCVNGEWQTITVTNGTAFTINAPANPPPAGFNRRLVVEVLNSSGGAMGVITWNGAFVFVGLVWANPANTKHRYVSFDWNGANWVATAISGADY